MIVPAKRCGRPRYGVSPYHRMILLHTALQGKVLALSSIVRYPKITLNPSQQNKCRYLLLLWVVVFCSSTSDTLVHFLYDFSFRTRTFSACCLRPVDHNELSCSRRRRSRGTSAPRVCCRSWELTKVGRRLPTFLLVLRYLAFIGQKLYMSLSVMNQPSLESYMSCFSIFSFQKIDLIRPISHILPSIMSVFRQESTWSGCLPRVVFIGSVIFISKLSIM